MIRSIPVILILLAAFGCGGGFSSDLAFQPDKTKSVIGIDQSRDGFFVLRYMAYKGDHAIGGTLNEFSIRNLTNELMEVEIIRLRQIFRGQDITREDSPVVYDGLRGGIQIDNVPTEGWVIAPGEWKSFDFPIKEISQYAEGDALDLEFEIKIRSGSTEFHEIFEFTKTLARSPRPWL